MNNNNLNTLQLKQESLFTNKKNQYQYQQQTADPEQIFRETLLGQSLIAALQSLKKQGKISENSKLPEMILSKFDKTYLEQFDQIPVLGDDTKNYNTFEGKSLSQSMINETESSLVSQLTAQNSHNSFNSANLGGCNTHLNASKLNLNKNKIIGTCREYKHLDDEWKFDVDNFSCIEATGGNVFNDPEPPFYGIKEQPVDINSRIQYGLPQDQYLNMMHMKNEYIFQQYMAHGHHQPILQNRTSNPSSESKYDPVNGISPMGGTNPIKLKNIENLNCKFVPSPLFIAQVRKRSGAAKGKK